MADFKLFSAPTGGQMTKTVLARNDRLAVWDNDLGASNNANKYIEPVDQLTASLAFNPIGFVPDFRISNIYLGPTYSAVNITLTLTASREYYMPLPIHSRMTINTLALIVTTGGAGGNAKMAIYAPSVAANGGLSPGLKVADGAAAFSLNTIGLSSCTITGGYVAEPGLYFIGLIGDTANAIRAYTSVGNLWGASSGSATTTLGESYYRAGTYASGLPADMTANTPGALSALGSNSPVLLVRPT